jgi:hypothetical protein
MRTLLAFAIALATLPALAEAQTPAAYEATHHGRVLSCYGHAYAIVELVDVATKNLALVASEAARESNAARQNVVAGMIASGTLIDQQQALDVTSRLESCVASAIERATPDAAAATASQALREEVAVAIMMADGFGSDYRQASPTLNKFLTAGDDPGLQAATNGTFSAFGDVVKSALIRVRVQVDSLIEKSTAQR